MSINPEALSPLLIELARAVRARSFFDAGHPTREHALAKAQALWSTQLERIGELDLEIDETGFRSTVAGALCGSSLTELAAMLNRHRIMGLQIHPSLKGSELETLIELIASEPMDIDARGGFGSCLREAGVKYVAVWEMPSPATPSPATPSPAPVAAAPTLQSAPVSQADRETENLLPQGEPFDRDDDTIIQNLKSTPELELPRGDDSELTVRLVHELATLDPCDDVGEYRLISNRVDGHIDRLLAMKNYTNAYRAALLFSRHSSDPSRSEDIRKEAVEHLRNLFRDEGMTDMLIQSSLGREGLKTIQAVQILSALAPNAVTRLLNEHTKGDRQTQDAVTSVLVAMGEGVIPVLADEFDTESPGRARRAAKIIGDLQHPTGVAILGEHLNRGDENLQREVAQSLARIGTPEAIDILSSAFDGPHELGITALNGLSYCRGSQAIQVLVGVTRRVKDYGEELRLEAIRGLGRIRDPLGVPTLREILDRDGLMSRRKNRPLRLAAATSLARIGDEEAVLALQTHASSGDSTVSKTCRDLLRSLEARARS